MLSIFAQILVKLIKYLRVMGRKHGPSKYSNTRYIIPFISVHFVDYTSGKPQLTPQTPHYRDAHILSRFLLLTGY